MTHQEDFERRCLDRFIARREAGTLIDDNGAPTTAESLFWKEADGSYGVRAFNAAWIAYQWGVEAGGLDIDRLTLEKKAAAMNYSKALDSARSRIAELEEETADLAMLADQYKAERDAARQAYGLLSGGSK